MPVMPGPPKQRGSVRNVTIEGDESGRTYFCEVRAEHGLQVGCRVWIEFGVAWAEIQGEKVRVPGQWRLCEIQPGPAGTSADVHVRVPPLEWPTTCQCYQGWVCEDHPEQPLNHDDCRGAGRQCLNPNCPWWAGPKPAALDLESEMKPPS